MGWRDHLLRFLAQGVETAEGARLATQTILRVLDRIDADPELSARLDRLGEREFVAEFLALYEAEARRPR